VREVFADTFYFLALSNPADPYHDRAEAAQFDISRMLITTVWVLTEVGDALAAPWYRDKFCELLDILWEDPRVIVLPASQEHFRAGIELYRARADKGWSVTDCICFAVMEERGITEALTKDRHFEQAGFVALLK
jgi:hypothetical protein